MHGIGKRFPGLSINLLRSGSLGEFGDLGVSRVSVG